MQWDATAATGDLLLTNATALDTSPGLNINITADHTGALAIVGNQRLRLNTNSLMIASGVGAFSFGNGTATVGFPIALAGAGNGAVHAWTNNSAFTATINSEVNFLMGGGGGHSLLLAGAGNWNVFSQLQAQNSGAGLALTVSGSGTVVYAPTNAPATTFSGTFNGITINSGTLKLGNVAAVSGTMTINGGTLDINGFSITNNLSGSGSVDTTLVGGTPTLTISNNNNTTLSGGIKNTAGTLSLVKRGAGTLTLSGANTYSGTTTVSAGALVVNGSIGSGDVSVASGVGFGGSGAVGGNVTWQSGASATFVVTNTGGGNGTPLTVAGSATLNNNSVVINVAGNTPLPVGTYTILNAGSLSGSLVNPPSYSGAGVASGAGSSISINGGVATLSVTNLGTSGTWITDLAGGTGNWSTSGNWQNNIVPQNRGDVAIFGVGSAFSTVTLDANLSLGGMTFTNANSFAIANAGNTLTLDDVGTGVTLAVNAGTSNAIATTLSLNDKVAVNVPSPNVLKISGSIGGTAATNTLAKVGNGTLILSGNNTYGPVAGAIGTLVSGGTLELGSSHALGTGDVTNSASTSLKLDLPMTLANKLGISSGSTVSLDDSGNSVTLTGGLAGSGSVTKIGPGNDTLSYSGSSTLGSLTLSTNGSFEIASGTIAASGQLIVDNGGTLQVDAGVALNFNASAFGAIGNTPFTTSTNIVNGTLNYNNANFVVGRNGSGVLTINSGVFSCNSFFDGQNSAGETGTVNLNGGTLLVTNIQSTGTSFNYFYFNGGAVAAKGPNASFWAGSGQLGVYVGGNPGTISNGGFNITIGQSILSETGTDGGMIFGGAGVTTVTNVSTYTGPTVVKGGTLLVNGPAGQIGSGDVTVANGASFGGTGIASGNVIWQSGSSVFFVITNSAGVNTSPFTAYGAVTLNNNNVIINVPGTSPLPVGVYTLMTSGGGSGSFAVTPTFTGAGVAGGTVSTVTFSGGLATLTVSVGGNSWSFDGNGNWSTASDWSGNPVIPSLPGDSAVLGVGSAFNTVTLDTNISLGAVSFTNANSFAIANGGKTLTLTNNAGNIAVNFSAGSSNSIAAPMVLNGAVGITGSDSAALQIAGGITGPGSLNVGGDGTGALTLAGTNSFSGGTTVSAGNLVLGSTNAIGTNKLTFVGGAIDSAVTNLVMANNNPQVWLGSFSFLGSNNLNMGTGTVAVSNNITVSITNNLVLGGTISASAFTVGFVGNGTLELDGTNSFGTVNSGVSVLFFGNSSSAGTGTLNAFSPTAAFASSSSATRTIHNVLGTGNGANGWSFVGAGNLIFDGGVTSYNFGKTVTVSNAVTTWNFALPSGGGGTTKLGPGTLVLGGANGNSGGNVVTEGTLALANSGALGAGPLTMSGGNLDSLTANLTNINFNSETWNTNFTFFGSQNLDLGLGDVTMTTNVAITVNANTLTIDGGITDAGLVYSLTFAGPGTLALNGVNTYTGDTTIQSGTLVIGDPGSLNGGNYSGQITNNGTFAYSSSAAQTLSGVISGTGSLIKNGSSVLTLSGNNIYTGNTTVQGGTLELANADLSANSTISISNGATIQLDFAGMNQVHSLVLNGVVQPAGIYRSSTPGGYITGSGALQVVSSGPSGPARLTNSVSGSTLSLSWPTGQGWRLQMQTNGLASTSWIYITDGSINSTNVPINPQIPQVFYRLVYP